MKRLPKAPILSPVEIFQTEANRIINASHEGAILHKAKSIRDSGEPVETALHHFFRRRLPKIFEVQSGFFYSEDEKCSPQIDLMISLVSELHGLGPGDHYSRFVPYISTRVLGEVKNSAYRVGDAFSQISKILTDWDSMHDRSRASFPSTRKPMERPLSFLFFTNTKNLKIEKLKEIYRTKSIKPDYLVLFDRAKIIASHNPFFEFDKGGLTFAARRQVAQWAVFGPEEEDSTRGRLLLWLYFTIATAINWSGGNQSEFLSFTYAAEQHYRIKFKGALQDATENMFA